MSPPPYLSLSFALLQAYIFGCIGLICGIIYGLGGLLYDSLITLGWLASETSQGLSIGSLLGLLAVIGMPVIFALAGLTVGLLQVGVYNLAQRIHPTSLHSTK